MSKFKVGDQVKFNGEGTIHQLYSGGDGMSISINGAIMFVPSRTGITIEKVAPVYEWRDGDVVQGRGSTFVRMNARWAAPGLEGARWKDHYITPLVNYWGYHVLRYQAGGINE